MKHILVGFVLGAAVFAGAVAAKVVNVTNPMTSSLDANHHSILNGSVIFGEAFQAGYVSMGAGNVMFNDGGGHLLGVTSCAGDPSLNGLARPLGTICLSTVGLFRKSGPGDFDWQPV